MHGSTTAFALIGALALAAPAVAAIDNPGPLVDADWLEANLQTPGLVILDIRNDIDGGSYDAYRDGHIPGAIYSNYLEAGWRTERDGIVGMVPDVASLEVLVGSLGIDNDDHVVIVHGGVNASDFGSAARVYWTFNYLGHDAVSILDGGFRGWAADAGRPVITGNRTPEPTIFSAQPRLEVLIETAEVEAGLDDTSVLRIDARPAEQYFGLDKAGPARAPGRIPNSLGLDQGLFFTEDGQIRQRDEIAQMLPASVTAGEIDSVVSYCNTGHWAATNWFVLSEVMGYDNVRLYDASMTGWSLDPSRPLETGKGLWDAVSRWVSDYRG
jgi:thiosulfate/3-mercaptopyruvate sulfurtransferase